MVSKSELVPTILEASILVTHSFNLMVRCGNKQKQERLWCEHCKMVGHTKNTCGKIYGKLAKGTGTGSVRLLKIYILTLYYMG